MARPHLIHLYVIGREIGSTNLLVYGAGAKLLQVVNIEVGHDRDQLQADLAVTLPGETIHVSNLNGGLLLRGAVSSPQAAAMANDLAERAADGDVLSVLDVRPDQVLLEVQLVETSEEHLREIGIDLSVAGPRHHGPRKEAVPCLTTSILATSFAATANHRILMVLTLRSLPRHAPSSAARHHPALLSGRGAERFADRSLGPAACGRLG
eukprot:gene60443-82700_t